MPGILVSTERPGPETVDEPAEAAANVSYSDRLTEQLTA